MLESVRILFDPRVLSYAKILQIFVSVAADPTELNDRALTSGTQYRSEIWYTTPQQRAVATAYLAQLSAAHVWSQPIVVRLDPAQPFYRPKPITRTSWYGIRKAPILLSMTCRK